MMMLCVFVILAKHILDIYITLELHQVFYTVSQDDSVGPVIFYVNAQTASALIQFDCVTTVKVHRLQSTHSTSEQRAELYYIARFGRDFIVCIFVITASFVYVDY